MPDVAIVASFPNEYEKDILIQVCERRKGNVVYVSQLARFGYSGAKLLLIYFNNAPLGVPFILKVALTKDIEREYNAVVQMRNWVQDCDLADDHIYKSGKWSALLYEHRGTDQPSPRAENPRSFRELLFCSDKKFSRKSLLSPLE